MRKHFDDEENENPYEIDNPFSIWTNRIILAVFYAMVSGEIAVLLYAAFTGEIWH